MYDGRDLETPQSCGKKKWLKQFLCHEAEKLRNGLNPTIKVMVLDSCGQKKRDTVKRDSKMKKL